MKKDIYTTCSSCGVDGMESVSTMSGDEMVFIEITCRRCGGDHKVSNLSLSDDLVDQINDMNDKIDDILEKVNE